MQNREVGEANAIVRREVINGDPVKYPNMVADTREYPIRDYGLIEAKAVKPGRAQKLTAEKVVEARKRYAAGESICSLAKWRSWN